MLTDADTDLQALIGIPYSLDADDLMTRLRIPVDSADAEAFARLVQLAEEVGNPKVAYREAYIEARDGDTVRVGGVTFLSRMLAKNLEPVERVFAFVATCGREVHEAFVPDGDFLAEFWWDAIMNQLLGAASRHLADHLHTTHRLEKTSTMSPGAGDADVWPIEQQEELFALLGDVRQAIGVELTDTCLMIPSKTVSGVRFATDVDFRSCQVCRRDPCPSRSAPFDEALWRELQHD